MSHTLKINNEIGVVVLRVGAIMSFEEIRHVLGEMVRLPGFRHGLCLVADFRGSGTKITGEEIRQLASEAAATDAAWGVTKWAIIASDDVVYGLSRMFGALTAEHRVTTHVFRSLAAADDWFDRGVEVHEILARTPED